MNSRLFTGIPCFLRAQAHDYKPRAIHSNEERFDRFLTTFLHGTDWTAGVRYFAIYWLRFREEARQLFSPLFENGSGRCAEAHLVEHLLLQLSVIHQDRLVSVYILQNSSPCYWCSDRYVENLRGLIAQSGLHVTVVFSSLHRIMRPSCLRSRHNHIVGADHKHVLNTNGLKKMRMCGIGGSCEGHYNSKIRGWKASTTGGLCGSRRTILSGTIFDSS